MLVLSRRRQETIIIDDKIKITVVDIKGDNVRIAIDAPSDIKIFRAEIYQAIARENREASMPVSIEDFAALKDIAKNK